ncbi:MAG: class I adenylate-forming enzyme family protein [Acidimicrobiia bacterium]
MITRTQFLLHDIARIGAERTPKRIAVSFRDQEVTFAELQTNIEHVAMVLAGRGVRHGDRVAVWADTCIEMPYLYYGIASLGAMFVPLNPRFSEDEARQVLDLAEPVVLIGNGVRPCDLTIEALMAAKEPSVVDIAEVSEWDAEVLFFTSGTTGAPKGAALSHRSDRMRTQAASNAPLGPSMSMFPMFHWGGWAFVHNALYTSDEIALVDATDAETLLETLERRKVNRFYAIPAVWKRILSADMKAFDLSALREANTGTSATPPELREAIHAALPDTTTSIGYGATEAGQLCWLSGADAFRKPYSVGLPAPGQDIKIVDDEFWVKGPQAFLGYYRNEEATSAAVVDGWYRTGDLVERDEEGYFWVVGRAKDMIRTGGEYVAPSELDVAFQRHPAVADGAAAGIPDDDWGEIVGAFVVLKPGATLDLAELRTHCAQTLAAYKHPRQLHIVDSIARTGATGQVQRRKLIEIAIARNGD